MASLAGLFRAAPKSSSDQASTRYAPPQGIEPAGSPASDSSTYHQQASTATPLDLSASDEDVAFSAVSHSDLRSDTDVSGVTKSVSGQSMWARYRSTPLARTVFRFQVNESLFASRVIVRS